MSKTATSPSTTVDDQLKSLRTTLNHLRDGQSILELAEALHEVVAAVRDTGKAASVTLKLTVAPATNTSNDHTLVVTDDIAVKYPKRARSATILFANESNQLSRRDPRQPSLAFDADQISRGVVSMTPDSGDNQ